MKKFFSIIISLIFIIQITGCTQSSTSTENPYRFGDIISYDAEESALKYLQSSNSVKVENGKYITFTPTEEVSDVGFIFYPGGLVEPESYAPIMNQIAEQGYKVIVVPMTMNLSILSGNKAESVIEENSEIEEWVIGGHSLGGVSACSYAVKDEKIKGVVLYASYPQDDALKNTDIKVLSLWGSEDGVADLDKVKAAKDNVNSDSEFIEIEGGNHGHFGDYGEQKGDGQSTITSEEQWNKAVEYTVEFLKSFN